MPKKSLWRCPNCGRKFSKKRQWHSCLSRPLEKHFEGKPRSLKVMFDHLVEKLRMFGPVRLDAVKTSINIAGKSHFAGVQVLKNGLKLGFVLNSKLHNRRIVSCQRLGKTVYGHSVKIVRKKDIDAELLRWLKRAYSLKS